MSCNLKLFCMNDIKAENVLWLWEPYIPFGKITIFQGDGGDGKTTTALAIAAAVTQGLQLPESHASLEPFNVIFQTAEDGLGDTIKPRLLQLKADCSRVFVIDESAKGLNLCDGRIEAALSHTRAKLFIIDPIQAYLGASVDMHRANQVRPVLKKVALLAEKYACAFIIIGHLNKGNNKSQYRGLGSIDIFSAARSVLTFGRIKDEQHMRAFAHIKSNLAPEGQSIAYQLDPETGFRWLGPYAISADELLGGETANWSSRETTLDNAKELISKGLENGPVLAIKMFEAAKAQNIGKRTLDTAKAELEVKSYKKENQWFWRLPSK